MVLHLGGGLVAEEVEAEAVFLVINDGEEPAAQFDPLHGSDRTLEDRQLNALPEVKASLRRGTEALLAGW